ncbi:MAG: tRNA uridine-5-carboxymethylaminomethyl(34) synthesis GTPase MnmE [Rhodospirillales bacterium]|nr:tRNA uridine-5-carboxymethylaminomethyl(34) synthesis GTPase MnmE [Rhodospirillales bacterium]
MTDTIYALASAPGRAGVAVVRVSGHGAYTSLQALSNKEPPPPRSSALRTLINNNNGETIDHALILAFKGPASFTGEDVVEYHLHGSRAVINALLAALAGQPGHRLAQPGEFTRRGFENGKMDLTAAEAVADLIDAETEEQKAQAMAQMEGSLSRLYEGWAADLTHALAYMEADLDFADEDLPDGIAAQVFPILDKLNQQITAHLDDNHRGERLRDGIQIAVIGEPNAGKSSIVNALARRDVAIVSPEAGTTRDIIEVHLNLNGYPVILADTAGLRPDQIGEEGQEGIESEGIRRAIRRAREADIKLLVFNGARLPDLDMYTLEMADKDALIAINKMDLYNGTIPTINGQKPVSLSIKQGEGVETLLKIMTERIEAMMGHHNNAAPALTRVRHREALEECRAALIRALSQSMPELIAEDTRLAIRALGRITGRVDVEDLLDVIFQDFCIGK